MAKPYLCAFMCIEFFMLTMTTINYCICIAEGEDEVTFDPDDIIEDVEEVDEGWWMGTVNGKRGLFPSNYVELI